MSDTKINILIVDDEEELLSAIKRMLEVRDFNVIAVNRGDKAVLAAREYPVDIALVDLKMPGMDGDETLKALKKEDKWMEIVILTGHGSISSAVECTLSGAYRYLQKPCPLDELLDTLKNAYRQRVMNKNNIAEKKMKELVEISISHSPRDILKRLKEIDREGPTKS